MLMAKRWKTNDSARTMAQKYNSLVDEVNQSKKTLDEQQEGQPTEKTGYAINGLTADAVNALIGTQRASAEEA